MTNYKQLCADLVAWAEKASAHYYSEPGVLIRARAALTEPEPEPEGPSLKEQALEALKHTEEGWRPVPADCAIIRRALESLPE